MPRAVRQQPPYQEQLSPGRKVMVYSHNISGHAVAILVYRAGDILARVGDSIWYVPEGQYTVLQ